jgi:hypothetical protein
MESVRNSIPFEILRFRAMDAAGSPGGVSRFRWCAKQHTHRDEPPHFFLSPAWITDDLIAPHFLRQMEKVPPHNRSRIPMGRKY